ncbi:hypothetical protein JW865_08890 [Candidatus Bathyarchaeota archaeon]|nr:hypothetical protein [Candidatus Bathyarchaeota archaeon]
MHRLLSLFFSILILSSSGLPNNITELNYKIEIKHFTLNTIEGEDIHQTNLNWMQGELNITFLEPIGDLIKFKASINVTYHSQPVYNRTSILLYNTVTNEISYLNNSIIGVTLFFKDSDDLIEDGLISNIPGFEYVCEKIVKSNENTVTGRQTCVLLVSHNVQIKIGSIGIACQYDEDTGIMVYSRRFVVDPILFSLGIYFLSTNWMNLVNEVDLGPTIFEWDLLFMKIGVVSGILLLLFLIDKRKKFIEYFK